MLYPRALRIPLSEITIPLAGPSGTFRIRRSPSKRPPTVNFSARIRQEGQVSVVEVSGKLTSLESGALSNSISQLLKEGRKHILLNLRSLTYLDSSGVGDLVRTYMTVIKRGGEMKVVGLTDKVEEILKITKLYQVFQEFQDERSALQSFPGNGSRGKTTLEIVRPHKN